MEVVDLRFKGVEHLIGREALARLAGASVCVVGLGGVGSWVVEALARSGVGGLTLVDMDEVCVTNINRQIQALSSTVGSPKADALAARVHEIHPTCSVRIVRRFFARSTADEILSHGHDLVVDGIDRIENKTLLIAECVRRQIRLITTGSAGDRTSPFGVQLVDLSRTVHDSLLQMVRKQLRTQYGFPRGERTKFLIPCIYSPKQRNAPRGACSAASVRSSCNDGLGSATFVTGAFGFCVAAEAVRILTEERTALPYPWFAKRAEALLDAPEREPQRAHENCAQSG